MDKETLFFIESVVSAVDVLENGLFKDFESNRKAVIDAAKELRDHYNHEIYDGPEDLPIG